MRIILIGMPLAGKTSVGREIALKLGYLFYDTDALIRQRYGSIKNAFKDGEESFRILENEVIEELLEKKDVVVASGGGIVTTERGRRNVLKFDRVVYLYAGLAELEKRFAYSDDRPLLGGKGDIERLFLERSELYSSLAHFTLVAEGVSLRDLADAVIGLI